jgi:hypothetical protein
MKKSSLVISILLTLFIVGAKSQTIKIDSGLVASYPFNGNALDESGMGNHGVVNEAMLVDDRFGNPNSAYWFDGISSFIIVPDHPSLDITENLTIAGWIKKDSHVPWASMVTKGGDSGQLDENNYTIHNDTVNSVIFTGLYDVPVYCSRSIMLMEWYFIALTYDGVTAKFYVDGVADSLSFTNTTQQLTPNASSLYIGVDHPGSTEFFHGCLDDIRIYNRALTPEEIEYLYLMKKDMISLSADWNLISLDNIPKNATPESVFTPLISSNNLLMVSGYQNQQGVFFDPNGPQFLNTLQNIIPGEGYWVKVQSSASLTVEGFTYPPGYSIDLKAGWNLIGYWKSISTTPAQAFAPLITAGVLQMVTGFDQGGKYFDPNGPPQFNTLTEIKNGLGYWVKVNSNTNFIFPQ